MGEHVAGLTGLGHDPVRKFLEPERMVRVLWLK